MTIPNAEILKGLAAIDYELPDNPDDVFWFMETSANQHPDPSVEFKWIEHNQIPMYFKNHRFMGMSVKGQYPHFLHRDVEKRMEQVLCIMQKIE